MHVFKSVLFAGAAAILTATAASAAPIVLTFEGLGNNEQVADYYNGGFGGSGSGPGPNYGITFGDDTLSLISYTAGGTGNFASAPSGVTEIYFLSGSSDILNKASGFTTGFSFYYNAEETGSVSVYSGLDGTGTELATLLLPQTDFLIGEFNFVNIGVTFGGTAESVVFSGSANNIGFDNITLGSAIALPGVPLPASAPMFGAALLALGVVGYGVKRKKASTAA